MSSQEIDLNKKIAKDNSKFDEISENEKKVIEEYYYIIEAVASTIYSKKKLPSTVDYNDLLSIGVIGLLKAIRGFQEGKNTQFKTYANIRIKGEMLDLIRKEWSSKSPTKYNEFKDKIKDRVSQVIDGHLEHQKGDLKPVDLLSVATTSYVLSLDSELSFFDNNIPDESEQIESKFQEKEFFTEIGDVLKDMTKEDQDLIELFYRKGFSQKEISIHLNQSESTISRMHSRILSELKGRLKDVYNC